MSAAAGLAREGFIPFATTYAVFASRRAYDFIAMAIAEENLATFKRAISLIPRMAEANIIRFWSGVEGCTKDSLPVIGPSRTTPSPVHAFGFSGHGFCLGPAVGAVVTELLLSGETPTSIAAFDIGRF